MYALLLTAAIALAGQVATGHAPRYGSEAAAGSATREVEAPHHGAAEVQPLLSQQPGQLNSHLPSDYRAQGRAAGQQPLGEALPADNGHASSPPPRNNFAAVAETVAEVKPSQLISSLLKTPATNQLAGAPLSLAEAVEGASSRSEQTERVEAYWDLSAATADYYMTLREVIALQTMKQSVTQPSAEWEQARRSLMLRGKAARRSAQTAQVRLQRMIGQTGGALPLTSDLPHCGAYDTRYSKIFSGRLPSAEAQQLDELLPLAQQEIRNLAVNVAAALDWRNTVSQRRNPDTDGSGLLKAHELLSLSRRAFVQSLRDYNANIARYAEIATPGEVVTDRLVAMLIYTEAGGNRDIRRASREESQTHGTGAEHSILRRPKGQ